MGKISPDLSLVEIYTSKSVTNLESKSVAKTVRTEKQKNRV